MRTITTSTGTRIELDGDVLAVLEAVSRELKRRHALDYGFEEVAREIQHLVDQLTEDDLRSYLRESLFMSFNRFENERMTALVRRVMRESEREG